MPLYVINGSRVRLADSRDISVTEVLPRGTYNVLYDRMTGFSLSIVDNFEVLGRLYGDIETRCDRIIRTYNDRPKNTGVLLSGNKGSGKTLLVKLVASRLAEADIPTLIIKECPDDIPGMVDFLQSFDQKICVVFDEFEKIFGEVSEQLLTLFDGIRGSKTLFLLTANERRSISEFFINRPGRFYYHIPYKGLDEKFIREYANENLNLKSEIEHLVSFSKLIRDFNFDILQAIVEESNRYNERIAEVIQFINADLDSGSGSRWEVIEHELSEKYRDKIVIERDVSNGYYRTVFNGDSYIRFTNLSDEDEDDEASFQINPEDIVGFASGIFTVKNDYGTFKLAPKIEKTYNFSDFAYSD